jgi:DNA invertase Pin-like site-specific DNA recombinase
VHRNFVRSNGFAARRWDRRGWPPARSLLADDACAVFHFIVAQCAQHLVRTLEFVKESLAFAGDDSPMNTLLLSMLGAVAEFERSMILERQREGIAIAKAAGKYKGRKASLSQTQASELRKHLANGESVTALATEYGVSRQTVYNYKIA